MVRQNILPAESLRSPDRSFQDRQPKHYILLPAPLSGFLHIQLTLYYGWTFVQFSLIAAATAFLLDSDRVIGKQSLLTATIPNFTSGMFIMILFLLDFLSLFILTDLPCSFFFVSFVYLLN
mgnify:CR=1 FL=1